jgi:hypothetical protein
MHKPVTVPQDLRTLGDEPRTNNQRITRDLRFRDVFVTHSRSTR